MNWITKWLRVPTTNATKNVPAVQLWRVRWHGRKGVHISFTEPHVEGFPTQAEADYFADGLRAAFRLLRITGEGTNVTVEPAA